LNRDPKRLARLARAQEKLARLLEARLLSEEATIREMVTRRRGIEEAAQLIPVAFLPGALRGLVEAEAIQKTLEQSAAMLRQQRLAVEGRRRTVSLHMDVAEEKRERKAQEEGVLESSLIIAKASGKHGMVK
jgi:hypothetical protein